MSRPAGMDRLGIRPPDVLTVRFSSCNPDPNWRSTTASCLIRRPSAEETSYQSHFQHCQHHPSFSLVMDLSHDTIPLLDATKAAEKKDQHLEQTNIIAVQRQETEEELSIAALLTPICPANNWFCQPCGTQSYQCIHCGTSYCTYGCMRQDYDVHRSNRMCQILQLLKKQNKRRKRREHLRALIRSFQPKRMSLVYGPTIKDTIKEMEDREKDINSGRPSQREFSKHSGDPRNL
jgi:hypothetical protein